MAMAGRRAIAAGDQLARVALAVLVHEQTASGLASAAVYAATFVPALIGECC